MSQSQRGSVEVVGLTLGQKRVLLDVARRSLRAAVLGKSEPVLSREDPTLRAPRGCFVTLTTGGELRGCIGFIRAREPLIESVSKMAGQAALHDPRFHPVEGTELPAIEIEISVLSELELITRAEQVEVGVHGLYIAQKGRSGLLLPQVAVELGWDRETFLSQTCRKAGLPENAWKQGAEIHRFSAEIFSEGSVGGDEHS